MTSKNKACQTKHSPIDIAAIPVQDDVPLDRRRMTCRQALIDKLSSMQPGQSFIVPSSLVSSVYQAKEVLKSRAKFATRRESADTVRVWRVS